MFDLDEYSARIALRETLRVSEASLEALHRAQVCAIPFENFDVLLRRGPSVEPDAIYEKTVRARRGGYCFELNGLALSALQHAGFEARALLARVHLGGEPAGRTHQISLVRLDGRDFILDVGFGGSGPRAPMPLEHGRIADQDGARFRFVDAEAFGTLLQVEQAGEWLSLYSFDRSHVCPADIELGNYFTSTHPSSPFTSMRMVSLHTAQGRVSLAEQMLTRVVNGASSQEQIDPGEPYLVLLRDTFGIELDVRYEQIVPGPR